MNKFLIMTLLIGLSFNGVAGELIKINGRQGRTNHQFLYEKGCKSCHHSPRTVTDKACKACHGTVNEIDINPKRLINPKANPHRSFHYKNGVSCLACHKEHKASAPICADCHKAWFNVR